MSENIKKVPAVVVKRLPRYYRYLGELMKQGIKRISSNALSVKMNVTASQIRQDFNYFGGFGQQGYGYNVEHLHSEIGEILGLNDGDTTVIVGAGNLGRALASHNTFEKRGFKLIGIFDNDKSIIGTVINGVEVMSVDALEDFLRANRVDIGILTVPKAAVVETAERLVKCGVKGLMNFSYTELNFDKRVAVENVHLSDPLMTLSYKIKQNKNEELT
ncbi:MAG: redox-sensing transcriptional repressor Rex [Firmicutes bacterium]|nr:redox-sensing transcriptional repressor Rex [Bacillota bacterium]